MQLISRFLDQHGDPFIAWTSGRNPHLQIIVGDRQRPVFEGQRWTPGADVRVAEAGCQLRADAAQLGAAIADDRWVHLVAQARGLGAGTVGVREDVQVRQRRGRQIARFAAKSASVSPGKPAIMSEPIDACGRRAWMLSTRRR